MLDLVSRGRTYVLALALLVILTSLPLPATAQTSPAQIDVRIDILTMAIWPEYDRAETLVVYRIQLDDESPLPPELAFRLPAYVEEMHAVAYEDSSGGLMSLGQEAIDLRREDDGLWLTIPVTSPRLQFEYYDPNILAKEGDVRQLTYEFTAPYPITTASFEVQEPFEAEDYLLSPSPKSTITGGDHLRYHIITANDLAAGEQLKLSASYKRATDGPSLDVIRAEAAASTTPSSSFLASELPVWVYIAVGLIGLLLLAGVGYWWWKGRSNAQKTQKRNGVKAKSTRYCHNCGAALGKKDHFCKACGTEVRGR